MEGVRELWDVNLVIPIGPTLVLFFGALIGMFCTLIFQWGRKR